VNTQKENQNNKNSSNEVEDLMLKRASSATNQLMMGGTLVGMCGRDEEL